jgi:hypothetical protein
MRFARRAGLALLLAAICLQANDHAPDALYEATGREPYYQGKQGFPDVVHTRNHAYKEFQREVKAGRIDPSQEEYFCYLYTLDPGGGRPVRFFHSPWAKAAFEKTENGSMRHRVASPLAEGNGIRIFTLFHSHPTSLQGGQGPSRVDVATASRFKNADGSYRYLYLVNNHGQLVQFKARRDLDPHDPAALSTMPVKPRRLVDWFD